jgi:hypothetical protein
VTFGRAVGIFDIGDAKSATLFISLPLIILNEPGSSRSSLNSSRTYGS